MGAAVELWTQGGRTIKELDGARAAIGKDAGNELVLDDPTVSKLHALLERFAAGWCVTDLGSSNGTFVNGERIWAPRQLRHGDEVRIGQVRLVFRDFDQLGRTATESVASAPDLTARERDVLTVLCRPLLDRDLFTEPASIREIASALVVSEAAVKQHVANLYAKFGIDEGVSHRRARLANEALRRAAVTLSDLNRPLPG